MERRLTGEEIVEATKEGARLQLRPKVMTVATIVASLLPILWSDRPGVEMMKPLATPVIGGDVEQPAAYFNCHPGDLCLASGEGSKGNGCGGP